MLNKQSAYRLSIFLLIVLCCLLALTFYLKVNNLVINYTASYPFGLYKKTGIDRGIRVGDWVMFCLPGNPTTRLIIERGYLLNGRCQQDHLPLIKQVYAIGGDYVAVSEHGVSINHGPVIKNTAPVLKDTKGRALPIMVSGRVQLNHYALFSEYDARSFDSRYFGAVSRDNIFTVIEPFWVLRGNL